MEASLDIFCNIKSKDFVLINQGIDPASGHCVSCGPLIRIPEAEMQIQGLDVVLKELEKFESRDASEKSELDLMSSTNERRFYREHKCVGVWCNSNDELTLQGMEKVRGRPAEGNEEGRFILSLPSSNAEFAELLSRALAKSD